MQNFVIAKQKQNRQLIDAIDLLKLFLDRIIGSAMTRRLVFCVVIVTYVLQLKLRLLVLTKPAFFFSICIPLTFVSQIFSKNYYSRETYFDLLF